MLRLQFAMLVLEREQRLRPTLHLRVLVRDHALEALLLLLQLGKLLLVLLHSFVHFQLRRMQLRRQLLTLLRERLRRLEGHALLAVRNLEPASDLRELLLRACAPLRVILLHALPVLHRVLRVPLVKAFRRAHLVHALADDGICHAKLLLEKSFHLHALLDVRLDLEQITFPVLELLVDALIAPLPLARLRGILLRELARAVLLLGEIYRGPAQRLNLLGNHVVVDTTTTHCDER
mmetsp:Transcript_16494/g.42154  ORF Transcript_16494/g.42154 Transcript_16494/m.42154 type:complete len:235 (+) Transcript_16494:1316-2020(+)